MSKSELLSKNSSPEEFFFSCSLCETSWDCLRRLIDTQTADSTWVFFFFPFIFSFIFPKNVCIILQKSIFFWLCVCVCEVSAARVPSQFLNLDLKILGQNLNIFTSVQKKENRKVSHCTPSLSVNLKILSYICSDLLPPYVSGHFVELPSTVHCSAGNRSAHVLWCKCDVPPPSRQLYHTLAEFRTPWPPFREHEWQHKNPSSTHGQCPGEAIHHQTTVSTPPKSQWQQKPHKWPRSKVHIPQCLIQRIAPFNIFCLLTVFCGSCGWGSLFSLMVKLPILLGKRPPVPVNSWAVFYELHAWDLPRVA